MPNHSYATKASLAYAKLMATPTEKSWSQVYNAGNLFVCVSLEKEAVSQEASLHVLGKELFNALEAEFFTLEEKNLETIKGAIADSTKNIPPEIQLNLCLAFFKGSILYLFLVGKGRVIMKRSGRTGVLLENKEGKKEAFVTASGYLENTDTVVLETKQFSESIHDDTLKSALELALPNDIAEALSPQLHESDDGGQAAVIIVYHGVGKTEPEEQEEELCIITPTSYSKTHTDEDYEEEKIEKKRRHITLPSFFAYTKVLKTFRMPAVRLSLNRKLFLGLTIILIIILIIGIFSVKKKQADNKIHTLFQSFYPQAQQAYDQGKTLESLNKSEAHDDFQKAEKLLQENQNKFKSGSNERTQIDALLNKTETALTAANMTNTVSTKIASLGETDILSIEKTNTDGLSFGQNTDTVYGVTAKIIFSVNKNSGKKTDVIKNDNDWQSAVAIIPYLSNVYMLDQKNGVLKYVAGSGGFEKNNYFSDKAPDMTKATAMAIDGSIWILMQDGSIQKYTRGSADNFKISGLDKPFANPKKIFTDIDATSLYVLDNGNNRIVKLGKDGSFQTQYTASAIKDAKDFEVSEKDKKIYILSGDKTYEIDM